MVVCWQADTFWNKVKENSVDIDDIEKYIYSSEYLNIQNPIECNEIKNIYNANLIQYSFEIENYQNEKNYEEIFYQGFLDGEFDEKNYYYAENLFKEFIEFLFSASNMYVYYDFLVPIENSCPFQKSTDVDFNLDFIRGNQCKFTKIIDKFQLEQISILFAREIVSGYIVLDDIKSVLVCSGMHGGIFSSNELDASLLAVAPLQIKKVSSLGNERC